MKKSLLCLFLALALLITIVPAMAESAEEPYTFTYISSRNETDGVNMALREIIGMYQEEHPNFNMELECIPDRTAFLQKIKILAGSNELPEWFDADPETFFASLVDSGIVYNVEDLYKELGIDDRFFNISKEYARLPDGRLYLMTFECNAEYFFYNKDLFAKAGIESVPTTMDELVAACDKLVEIGVTPFAMGDSWPKLRYFAMVPFRMAGNDYIEQASLGNSSFGGEVGLEGARWMQKLASYFQEGWTTADYDTMVNLFLSGDCAMLYNGTWVTKSLSDETGNLKPFIGTFGMPTYSENDVTGEFDYFANSGIGLAFRADAMDDQMKDFIKFFVEKYGDLAVTKYNYLASVRPSDMDALSDTTKMIVEDASKVNKYAKCWDVVIDQASLDALLSNTVDLCLGAITPEEWCDEMDRTVAENLQ